MTVVIGMVFNSKEGAMIADEATTSGDEKYHIRVKLKRLQSRNKEIESIIGAAGRTDFIDAVQFKLGDKANRKHHSAEEFSQSVSRHIRETRMTLTENSIQTNLGLTLQQFQQGKNKKGKIIEKIIEKGMEYLNGEDDESEDMFNCTFLSLTKDKENIFLRKYDVENNTPRVNWYEFMSIGAGQTAADLSLKKYMESMPKEKRKNIPPNQGIIELLHATSESTEHHKSVGGIPQLIIFTKDSILEPAESNTNAASQAVKAYKRGFVPEKFASYAVNELLYKGSDFKKVDREMFQAAGRKSERLDRLLRGYRE